MPPRDAVCNPELNQLRTMQNALDATIGALLRSPTKGEPTVEQRDAKLLLALDCIDEATTLVTDATEGLYLDGKTDFAATSCDLDAAIGRMRSDLRRGAKKETTP